MQHRYRRGALFACLLLLGACQVRLPVQAAGQTAAIDPAAFPENDVVEGVKAFRSTYSTSGMSGVGRNVAKCQDAVARHAAVDLVRECLAFEMAALIVSAAHDDRMHAQPLPNMSEADFTRRFDIYFGAMGVSPGSRGAAADALFKRVLPLVQPS